MKNYKEFILEFWGSGTNKDFDGTYTRNPKDKYEYIGFNEFDFEAIVDDVIEVKKSEIEDYVSLDTIKTMFPIFKKFDFSNDWSIKIYKYKNYLIIYKSGYYYTFKKN